MDYKQGYNDGYATGLRGQVPLIDWPMNIGDCDNEYERGYTQGYEEGSRDRLHQNQMVMMQKY